MRARDEILQVGQHLRREIRIELNCDAMLKEAIGEEEALLKQEEGRAEHIQHLEKVLAVLTPMLNAELWCVHIFATGEKQAAPSLLDAEERIAQLSPNFSLRARPIPWTGSPESHAESVQKWDAFTSIPPFDPRSPSGQA